MRWTELTLLIGLLICIAAPILLVRRRLSWVREHPGQFSKRLESLDEIAIQALPFGGILLMQFANLVDHVREETLPQNIWLSIGSGALMLLVFGMQLGRLLMRWQLRRLGDLLDTKSGVVHDNS